MTTGFIYCQKVKNMFTHTTALDSPDLDALLNAFPEEFVKISPKEQAVAIALYRLLALGESVSHQHLAEVSSTPVAEVHRLLGQWLGVYHDDAENVTGFWGLALGEMPHKLLIDGRELYAWCAWDTLFLPALIGNTVQVISQCAQSGKEIQLIIDPEHIASVYPETTVLSFVMPDENGIREDVINSFCHSVLFFATSALGEQWVAEHPKNFLISVENAFELAQMINHRKFPGLMTQYRNGVS